MTQIAVSPNGKLLALFGDTGFLWVVSADFKKKLSEFNTKSKVAPLQLVWYDSLSSFLHVATLFLFLTRARAHIIAGAEQTPWLRSGKTCFL